MHSTYPTIVYGYHGTSDIIAKQVINGEIRLEQKEEPYHWLGQGIYFWENSCKRALDFAIEKKKRDERNGTNRFQGNPTVIGTVIELGRCLNLLDPMGVDSVKKAYEALKEFTKHSDLEMPKNKSAYEEDHDKLFRNLDCAVIDMVHSILKKNNKPAYDSVRAVFIEGKPLYDGAGFQEKNHIQICIVNPACIKGSFYLPGCINNCVKCD
jgi:hypothetical protein